MLPTSNVFKRKRVILNLKSPCSSSSLQISLLHILDTMSSVLVKWKVLQIMTEYPSDVYGQGSTEMITHFRCVLCWPVVDFCSCEVKISILPWSDYYHMRYVGSWRDPIKFNVELATNHSECFWVETVITQLHPKSSTRTNIVQRIL